jgi:hypothetical protein
MTQFSLRRLRAVLDSANNDGFTHTAFGFFIF